MCTHYPEAPLSSSASKKAVISFAHIVSIFYLARTIVYCISYGKYNRRAYSAQGPLFIC